MRVGRDVEILRLYAEQQVAHGAADQERLVAALAQPIQHAQRARRDVGPRDRMIGAGNDDRLRRAAGVRTGDREQFVGFRWTVANGCV